MNNDDLCGNCGQRRGGHYGPPECSNWCPKPDGSFSENAGHGKWQDYPTPPFMVECLDAANCPADFLIVGSRYNVIGFNTTLSFTDQIPRFILAESPEGYSYKGSRFKLIYSTTEMSIQPRPIIDVVPVVKEEPPFDFRKYYYGDEQQ